MSSKKVETHVPNLPIFSGKFKIKWFFLYILFEKSIFFLQMDVWKNKKKSLKTPWKWTSKLLEKGNVIIDYSHNVTWYCWYIVLHRNSYTIARVDSNLVQIFVL